MMATTPVNSTAHSSAAVACAIRNTPFVRLAKRDAMPSRVTWAIRGAALLFALFLGGLIISITTYGVSSFGGIFANIFNAYGVLLEGALGKSTAIRQTVKLAIPLLGTALAIAPCFKMRFWNIGAEGQITAGATFATYFALFWADKMPSPVLLVVMAVAGMVGGGLWALVPAFFKAKWGTNETLFTLMMNYIVIGVVKWLQGGPWEKMPRGSQQIAQFGAAAQLPKVAGVYCGWIIVLVMTVLMFLYMKYTKQGYEIAVVGESENTARYAGMNVGGIVMRTMFISGAISGLVGFMLVSGANGTLYDGVAGGVGFTAITVAWLSQLNPFGMVAVSGLLAVLEKGADTLQTRMQVPASISDIMTGLVLFVMLGCEFFINYRLIFRGSEQKEGAKA
ncbi:conserved membrane hypothetical protein [uncultured Eubacteriales bacterium]|uniref:ABC transporter permease n=1 Tax=uncultured Eubacteriales bacterium TaxID=172733 RepID=A0A212KLR2_9FIRM|nr:conserved membrane hypothetical protein [uncultured Eubacteriales bacterium]